jgi:uncharacterized protein (TIGR02996 family)
VNDGLLLLRAIVENPDDTFARLVYADWLDEHGEPEQAEFIRLTCDGSRWRPLTRPQREPDAWLLEDAAGRARELLYEKEADWLGSWWPVRTGSQLAKPPLLWSPLWHRGFVESVVISRGHMREYGPRLVASQPITRVFLWPCSRRERSRNGLREEDCRALAWAREQAGLRPLPRDAVPLCQVAGSGRWPWSGREVHGSAVDALHQECLTP